FTMPLLIVIRAEFLVRRLPREDVIGNRQDLMRDRDDRPLVPAAPLNPLIESGERGGFRPAGGSGGFDERQTQGGFVVPCTRAPPLAAALSRPGTAAAPAPQMAVAGKLRHVPACFGQDDFSRPLFDTRNRLQAGHRRYERGEVLGDPRAACRNDF